MARVDAKISSPLTLPSPPVPVEASGDSEEVCFDPLQLVSAGCGLASGTVVVDDDDTESCSSDNHGGLEFGARGLDGSNGGDSGGEESGEEEEEASEGGRELHHEGAMAWPPAGGIALASEEESDLDEAEKNKIFWEMCLQSGYP